VTSPGTPKTPRKGSYFLGRHAVALILAVLAVIFIAENTKRVKIRALGPTVSTPLWLALLITLVAGMLIPILSRRRRNRR
jgi:lipopolysaccharide assembly protein A